MSKRAVVEAFDVQTGVTRRRRSLFSRVFAGGGRLAADEGIVVAMLDRVTMEAFDAATGESLWRREISNRGGDGMIVDAGRVFTMLAEPRRMAAYDLHTGEPVWTREVYLAAVRGALERRRDRLRRLGLRLRRCGGGRRDRRRRAALAPRPRGASCATSTPCASPRRSSTAPNCSTDEGAVRRRSDGAVVDRIHGGGRVAASGATRVSVEAGGCTATDTRGRVRWISRAPEFNESYEDRPIIAGPQVFVAGMQPAPSRRGGLADGEPLWSDTRVLAVLLADADRAPRTLFAAEGEQLVAYGPATPGPVIRLTRWTRRRRDRRPR